MRTCFEKRSGSIAGRGPRCAKLQAERVGGPKSIVEAVMRARIVVSLMLLVAVLSALAGAHVVLTDDAFAWSQTPRANYGNQIALVVDGGDIRRAGSDSWT